MNRREFFALAAAGRLGATEETDALYDRSIVVDALCTEWKRADIAA